MAVTQSRYSTLFVIFTSVLLVFVVGGYFYYVQITKNEEFQNQLHFRELSQVSRTFKNGLQKIRSITQRLSDMGKNTKNEEIERDIFTLVKRSFPNAQIKKINPRITQISNKDSFLANKLYLQPPGGITDNIEQWSFVSCPVNRTLCFKVGEAGSDTGEANATVVSFPINDLLSGTGSVFPLLIFADSKGNVLFRENQSQLDAVYHGLSFEQVNPLLQQLIADTISGTEQSVLPFMGEEQTSSPVSEKKQDPGNGLSGISSFRDLELAGQDFRVFVSPVTFLAHGAKNEAAPYAFYLFGIKSLSSLTKEKFSISNSTMLVVVLIFLVFLAMVPWIKIRLISVHQAFKKRDLAMLTIGGVLLVMISTVGLTHFLIYSEFKQKIEYTAEQIHQEVKLGFTDELKHLIDKAIKAHDVLKSRQGTDFKRDITDASEKQIGESRYFLEGVFRLNASGVLKEQEPAIFISPKLSRGDLKDVVLYHREYAKRGIYCSGWPINFTSGSEVVLSDAEIPSPCSNTFFLERIFNLEDGRKNTWMSTSLKPDTNKPEKGLGPYWALAFGTRLQSMMPAVMPNHFGYAVFNNVNGDVLYHSQDERGLVENFYAETENNQKLQSIAQARFFEKSVSFVSSYRGRDHLMSAAPLIENMPLTLVVYYDKAKLRSLNMWSAFSSLSLSTLFFTIYYLLYLFFRSFKSSYMNSECSPSYWLWFDKQHAVSGAYKGLVFRGILYFMGWLVVFLYLVNMWDQLFNWYWLLGVCLLIIGGWFFYCHRCFRICGVRPATDTSTDRIEVQIRQFTAYLIVSISVVIALPVIILSYVSADFYLDKYAQLHGEYVEHAMDKARQEKQRYVESMLPAKYSKLLSSSVPCYLGEGGEAFNCDRNSLKNRMTQSWMSESVPADKSQSHLLASLWQVLVPKVGFAADIWLLSELSRKENNRPSHPGIDSLKLLTGSIVKNMELISLLWFLAVCTLYLLISRWICCRLMGIDVSPNYRLNENQYRAQKWHWLLEQIDCQRQGAHKVCIQIIRPGAELCLNLQQSNNEWHRVGNFVAEKPVSIREIADNQTQSVETLIANRLPRLKDNVNCTLVLKHLEILAMDKVLRLRALEILEHLLTIRYLALVLITDIAPLYRLTQQGAYPHGSLVSEPADVNEVIRWTRVMKRFSKMYDWTPDERKKLPTHASPFETLVFETGSWMESRKFAEEFLNYHCISKDPTLKMNDKLLEDFWNKEWSAKWSRSVDQHWSQEQVISFIGANAGAHARYRWELCTRAERVLLLQVCNGLVLNPMNRDALEHLVKRGYLFRDNGWHLVNENFRRFVLSAEPEEVVIEWLKEAEESNWKYARIPIIVILLGLLGAMAYSASEAFESLMAVMTATLGILPLIFRNISLLRSGSGE